MNSETQDPGTPKMPTGAKRMVAPISNVRYGFLLATGYIVSNLSFMSFSDAMEKVADAAKHGKGYAGLLKSEGVPGRWPEK
jgi:hypothetical protein